MTGEDIKEKIERYTDLTLRREKILDGIQEAINKLGVRNHIIDTIDIEAEKEQPYEMPKNFIQVIKVEIPEESKYYYNYMIDGNLIRFKNGNKYRIFSQKHPFDYENLNEELKIHPMLQSCILTYVKGFVRLSNNEGNEVGWNYIKQFNEESREAYQILKRDQKSPSTIKVFREA